MTPELFSHFNGLRKVLPVTFYVMMAIIVPATKLKLFYGPTVSFSLSEQISKSTPSCNALAEYWVGFKVLKFISWRVTY